MGVKPVLDHSEQSAVDPVRVKTEIRGDIIFYTRFDLLSLPTPNYWGGS